jgi:DNA-binding CsgD family transcriptional regulator
VNVPSSCRFIEGDVQYATARRSLLGDLSDWSIPMLNDNVQLDNVNEKRMELSEADKELIGLVASSLTDGEIATQLQVPKHIVSDHIARLLAKLGARERVEILFYAFSEPRCTSGSLLITTKTTKKPQPLKQKAS